MFRRLMIMLLLSLVSSVFIIPIRADDKAWTAWLFDTDSGQMTQVDASGSALEQFKLPITPNTAYFGGTVISDDGVMLAYVTHNDRLTQLKIYDLTRHRVIYRYDMPPDSTTSFQFGGSSLSFSENHQTLAFGHVSYYTPWEIVVVDLTQLSASTLKPDDPEASGLALKGTQFMPVVTYNRNNQIKFMMIPLISEALPKYKAFRWIRESDVITPDDTYITPDTATFVPTGEVLSNIFDNRFPDSSPDKTSNAVPNTLQAYNPADGRLSVIAQFTNAYRPRFIQGGERVAVMHFEMPDSGPRVDDIQILERDGSLLGSVNNQYASEVLGTEDGFIFSIWNPDTQNSSLYSVETRLAEDPYNPVLVWSSRPRTSPILIWVSNSDVVKTDSFIAWGDMQPPPDFIYKGGFTVGNQVIVQTTDNATLNIRSGPGRNFSRLDSVSNGAIVTLIEGPQNADGFIWWKIRLPSGIEGWVVTSADGVDTLVAQ